MRTILVVPLLVLAACGGDGGGGPSGPSPFDCLGQPLPTTAGDPLVVSGIVRSNPITPAALAGAQVVGYRTGNATKLDSTSSDATGNYTLTLATGGQPLDGYVRVFKSGYLDTYGYPPAPLVAGATQSALLITTSDLAALGMLAGVTQTAGKGLIAIVVSDCHGTPLSGATVSSNPAGTLRYNSGGFPSSTASATSADGVAYILNVTAGDVVVSATAATHVLRSHTVNARADAVTLTGVTPGP
jgi:hypothetical protein